MIPRLPIGVKSSKPKFIPPRVTVERPDVGLLVGDADDTTGEENVKEDEAVPTMLDTVNVWYLCLPAPVEA